MINLYMLCRYVHFRISLNSRISLQKVQWDCSFHFDACIYYWHKYSFEFYLLCQRVNSCLVHALWYRTTLSLFHYCIDRKEICKCLVSNSVFSWSSVLAQICWLVNWWNSCIILTCLYRNKNLEQPLYPVCIWTAN